MKISDVHSAVSVTPEPGRFFDIPSPPVPRVDVGDGGATSDDDKDSFKSATRRGAKAAAAERLARLQVLADAVRDGVYRPIAPALADQMMDQSTWDARLAGHYRHAAGSVHVEVTGDENSAGSAAPPVMSFPPPDQGLAPSLQQ